MSESLSIRDAITYNPITGEIRWAMSRPGRAVAGRIAGRKHRDGYWRVNVLGKEYLAHRLAWLLAFGSWPVNQIDHINGIRDDNRLSNLREASAGDNAKNSGLYSSNRSGARGVCRRKGRWVAQIQVNGQRLHLGSFPTIEAASATYKARAKQEFGAFFRAVA